MIGVILAVAMMQQLAGPRIQPPDKPCDTYQYEAVGMADKPGYAGKVLCTEMPHEVTEREWQQLMGRLKALENKK